jgi:hypothetical protein
MRVRPPFVRSASASEPLRWLATSGVVAVAMLLSGCARPIGDLGRPEPNFVSDVALPAIGAARADLTGAPSSSFNNTAAETDMDNRISRFVTSQHGRDPSFDAAAEMRRTGVGDGKPFPIGRYYSWLHSTPYRSAAVRYTTMSDDITADLATLPGTFAAICAVKRVEGQRRIAAYNLPGVEPAVDNDAAARRAEDDGRIDWFVQSLRYRHAAYGYALDHLLVETPDPAARIVDTQLTLLESDVDRADSGDFCDAPPSGHPGGSALDPVIPSRFVHGNPPPTATPPKLPAAG